MRRAMEGRIRAREAMAARGREDRRARHEIYPPNIGFPRNDLKSRATQPPITAALNTHHDWVKTLSRLSTLDWHARRQKGWRILYAKSNNMSGTVICLWGKCNALRRFVNSNVPENRRTERGPRCRKQCDWLIQGGGGPVQSGRVLVYNMAWAVMTWRSRPGCGERRAR